MAARVSQAGVLVVDQGTPKARASQVGLLVITPTIPRLAHKLIVLQAANRASTY